MSDIKKCPFCQVKGRILKENNLAYVLLSNPRKVAGHFLVIPKRHVEKPWEFSKDEISAIFEFVFFIQEKIATKFADGCDVRQNYRPFMKQGRVKVDHTHYHVYPRKLEDELYQRVEQFEGDMFIDLPNDEANEMAKLLND